MFGPLKNEDILTSSLVVAACHIPECTFKFWEEEKERAF